MGSGGVVLPHMRRMGYGRWHLPISMKTVVLLLVSTLSCYAQTVFSSDFDGGSIPVEVTAGSAALTPVQGYAGLGATGNAFGGSFLRSPTANTVTLQLSGLPAHGSVDIAFLLAAIDSLDGTGSYFTDSAYDLGREPALRGIPHTASSLTLQFVIEGAGVQNLGDESWAMDNLVVSLGNAALPQVLRLEPFKVTYPVGTTPYFTGVAYGAAPSANVTLQASTDLGFADPWVDLITLPANPGGAVSFLDVPDPSAAGSRRNFYRVKVP